MQREFLALDFTIEMQKPFSGIPDFRIRFVFRLKHQGKSQYQHLFVYGLLDWSFAGKKIESNCH